MTISVLNRAVLTTGLAGLAPLALGQVVELAWPGQVPMHGGGLSWRASACLLSAALGLLAVAVQSAGRPKWVGWELVFVLSGLALHALHLGCLRPRLALLVFEARHAPPLAELGVVLGRMDSLHVPLIWMLLALPVPLVVAGVLARQRSLVLVAGSACVAVSSLAGLSAVRLAGISRALHDPMGLAPFQASAPAWPAVLAFLVCAATLLWARAWLTAILWGLLAVMPADPLPGALLELYPASEVQDHRALLGCAGASVGSSQALLDLSGSSPRFAGLPLEGDLASTLRSSGYYDLGPDQRLDQLPVDPWSWEQHRAMRILPPADARVEQVLAPLATAARFGVSLWLWPGRPFTLPGGPAAAAFASPVLPVLLYEPLATAEGQQTCARVYLSPGLARLSDAAGRSLGSFEIPGQLSELRGEAGRCTGTLTLIPAPSTTLRELHQVADSLGGAAQGAPFRKRIALVLSEPARPQPPDEEVTLPGEGSL